MSYNRDNDPFPWKVTISRARYYNDRVPRNLYLEMSNFCHNMTDHWGYNNFTFMFAFEEHKNWFILKFGEYVK